MSSLKLFSCASALALASALCACGSDINIQNSGSQSAGSSGTSSSSGNPPGMPTTVPTDPGQPTDPPSKDVAGHYMQMIIGNCINAEDWLSFSALPAFTHTMVDRNYCSSHSVVSSPGSYAFLPGQVIETHSKNNTDGMNWTFTAHSFKPYPYLPPQPMPEGYAAGDRALNTMAYVCTTNVAVFRRTDIKRWISADGEYQQSVYIEAGFDKPFGPVNAPTPCHMSVKIQASVEGTTIQPESGEEVFSFSCTYGPVADSPWMRVSADGFGDNIYSGAWMDLLTQMGIWKKYSSPLSSLFYDQFYPLLYVAPDDANVIFDNRSTAWYQEMLDGPPDTVF